MNMDIKVLNKIKASNIYKEFYTMSEIYPRNARWFNKPSNMVNVIYHINRIQEIYHMILSADAEKAFNKTQHCFMIKW